MQQAPPDISILDPTSSPAAVTTVEAEFAQDRWNAIVLGIPARRGHGTATFTNITQPWLRDVGQGVVPVPARRRLLASAPSTPPARTWPASPRSSPVDPKWSTLPGWTVR